MLFKQIREIKAKYNGLILKTNQTNMYTNKEWASTWKIKLMSKKDIKELLNYLDKNELLYFFGSTGIHIQ